MKKVLLIVGAMIGALFLSWGAAPAANAYPEQSCNVEVSAQVVESGATFTASGESNQFTVDDGQGRSARAAADEVTWQITFNGETKTDSGDEFSVSFTAPEVTTTTKFPLTAKATLEDGTTTCEHNVDITVTPGGTEVVPPGEELPNTGGPRFELLILGLILVAAGTYAVRRGRRTLA